MAWGAMVLGLSLAMMLLLTLLFTAHLILLGLLVVVYARPSLLVGKQRVRR